MILGYVGEVACRASIDAKTNFQFQRFIPLEWSSRETKTLRTAKFNDRIHRVEVIILFHFIFVWTVFHRKYTE